MEHELNLSSFSLGLLPDGYSEKSLNPSSSSSPKRKVLKLTLFDDLLHNTNSFHPCINDSSSSDCGSGISGPDNEHTSNNGFIRIQQGEQIFKIINKKFVSSLNSYGLTGEIQGISRNGYSEIMNQVKYRSFFLYSRAMEIKHNGNANLKYAWYSASKNEIDNILSHGFSFPFNTGLYGRGVYLSPADLPGESVQYSEVDESGLRYMLLCRVLLGNTETVSPGSGQCNASSQEFDSGIDNFVSPKKYIIWNGNINTHILPEILVTFKASSYCQGCKNTLQTTKFPRSEWMPFATLINDLSMFLPYDDIKLITKYHYDYKKKNLSRNEMIQRVRHIAGDEILITIIKTYRTKRSKYTGGAAQSAFII